MKPNFFHHCVAKKFCANTKQLQDFSKEIITLIKPDEKVMLLGKMGSGKTTLVRYLLQLMNYDGAVPSPTFTLVNEYHIAPDKKLFSKNDGGLSGDSDLDDGLDGEFEKNLTLFHIDLYRLEGEDENIGLDEIFDSKAMVFVEWGERIDWIRERSTLLIDITFPSSGEGREVKIFSR